jgi:hypothetical protein
MSYATRPCRDCHNQPFRSMFAFDFDLPQKTNSCGAPRGGHETCQGCASSSADQNDARKEACDAASFRWLFEDTLAQTPSISTSFNNSLLTQEWNHVARHLPPFQTIPLSISENESPMNTLRHVSENPWTGTPSSSLSGLAVDRVPGVYEGGAALWEGSVDLVRFLHAILHDHDESNHSALVNQILRPALLRLVQGTNDSCSSVVLELGCGHALPIIYLLRQSLLHHQQNKARNDSRLPTFVCTDYNHQVLRSVTLPNLVLNTMDLAPSHVSDHVRLGAGDWRGLSRQGLFHDTITASTVDCILASETLYTPEAAQATAEMVALYLRDSTGIALIATKRYYFGVGGGVDAFRLALQQHNEMVVDTVRVWDNGSSNIREILLVRKQPGASTARPGAAQQDIVQN